MEIARKMYLRAGILWREARQDDPEVNPWGIKFSAMFHMSGDSGLFKTRQELEDEGWQLHGNVFASGGERYLPLYEAKLFHQYDHRFATFEGLSAAEQGKGNARSMTSQEKEKPRSVALPRYWVPEDEVLSRLDKREKFVQLERTSEPRNLGTSDTLGTKSEPRHPHQIGSQLAHRNITNATNERTGIFAMIPIVTLGHSGTVVIVGSLYSETFQVQQINEPQSSQPYKERQ